MANANGQENYTLAWVRTGETATGDDAYFPKDLVPEHDFWPFFQRGALDIQQNRDILAAQDQIDAGWIWQEDELILGSDEEDESKFGIRSG